MKQKIKIIETKGKKFLHFFKKQFEFLADNVIKNLN